MTLPIQASSLSQIVRERDIFLLTDAGPEG